MTAKAPLRVIGFFTRYERNPETGVMDREVEFVTYSPAHDPRQTTDVQVPRLKPPQAFQRDDGGMKMAFARARWAAIEPAYEAWKRGSEIPVDGTALAAWPGVTPEQAVILRNHGLRTIEEVATMPETVIGRVPLPGVRELRKQAGLFLENRERTGVAAKLAEKDEQIAGMQQQIADLVAAMKEMAPPKGRRAEKEAA